MKPNGVLIIPTGLGCALGGDAAFNPGVKLIAACTENLIVNPNAVNASDINELPSNALYVEGSTIDRFLEGRLNLRKVRSHNRILMAVNPPVLPLHVNTCNAGIWGLGADIHILALDEPLLMEARKNDDGTAGGVYSGVDSLVEQVSSLDFDALALHTSIECDDAVAADYWLHGGVNPWGGVEAIVSKAIAEKVNKPVAHAPTDTGDEHEQMLHTELVVKRAMAPEIISNTYMFCVFKGLHRSPQLELDVTKSHADLLSNRDIDFMVSPHGCFGRPHWACINAGIPIIVVRENTTCFSGIFQYPVTEGLVFVDNYLEAAGLIMSMSCGVDYRTVLLGD